MHLYHARKNYKKYFNIPVFLHHINLRKRAYKISHLRKPKNCEAMVKCTCTCIFTFKINICKNKRSIKLIHINIE